MLLTLIQVIIGPFFVSLVINSLINSIAYMPDASMGGISKVIKSEEGVVYVIKYVLSTLATLLFAILICVLIGVSYTAAMIFLPLSFTNFSMTIILAKAEKMPIAMFRRVLRTLLIENLFSKDQRRNTKKLFMWFLIDLFFARASREQIQGLIFYFKATISLAKSKSKINPLEFRKVLQEYNYEMILILFVILFTGIYVICLSVAITQMINGADTTPELTTGFISLVFGILLMLNYERLQELQNNI